MLKGFLLRKTAGVRPEQVEEAGNNTGDASRKVESSGIFGRYLEELRTVIAMLNDYREGKYRQIPWWAICGAALVVLYILNPIDIIPDFIPFIGQIDDLFVIGVFLALIRRELATYREWRAQQTTAPPDPKPGQVKSGQNE
jgi:uncharacterized membrane protein YkvA (DUF1232 family)